MYDMFICCGMVVDGSGEKAYPANVGIKGDQIAYIGPEMREAKKIVNAEGKLITPGFIDAHSHGDFNLGYEFQSIAKISQGITTECAGNCGSAAFPVSEKYRELFLQITNGWIREEDISNISAFTDVDSFINYSNKKKLHLNTAMAVGHSYVRLAVMGMENREPTKEEMEQMKAYVKEAMERGAFGLSSGLIYPPGPYASTEELVELCKIVKEYDGMYITHLRNESDSVEEALQEAIDIAEQAGVKLWISHHKLLV